jgi:hypothetical protein
MQGKFGYDGEVGKNVVQNTGNAGYQLRALIYMTKCIATLVGNSPKFFFFLSGYSQSKLLKGSAEKEKQEVIHKVLDISKEHV